MQERGETHPYSTHTKVARLSRGVTLILIRGEAGVDFVGEAVSREYICALRSYITLSTPYILPTIR